MRCPNCDHQLCSECGRSLNNWNTFDQGCDDHNDQICWECAGDLFCKDCDEIAAERERENA